VDDLERILKVHPFMADLEPEHVRFLVGCAKNMRYPAGTYLIREGARENTLFLIRQGTVAIEIPKPGGEPVCVETVGAGDVLGISRVTPVSAHLDCRARDTVVAFALDNECMLKKMHEDPRLGFAISMHLLERTYDRLARARLQHLDVYS
jgi:CRP-like cAMP-binding protein